MDQLEQIVFVTVFIAVDDFLFDLARLALTNLRILLSLLKLDEVPFVIKFTNP